MGWHKPICSECQIGMYIETQGVYIVDEILKTPTLITSADLYRCPICDKQTISGFANQGISRNDERFWIVHKNMIDKDLTRFHVKLGDVTFNRDNTYAPICGKCNQNMYIKSKVAYSIDMFSNPPRPYKIISCSLYACPECFRVTASSFSDSDLMHHHDGFDATLNNIIEDHIPYVVCYERKQDAIDMVQWGDAK